jgi:hypothetical protein
VTRRAKKWGCALIFLKCGFLYYVLRFFMIYSIVFRDFWQILGDIRSFFRSDLGGEVGILLPTLGL